MLQCFRQIRWTFDFEVDLQSGEQEGESGGRVGAELEAAGMIIDGLDPYGRRGA
jgi:hypothetical protein